MKDCRFIVGKKGSEMKRKNISRSSRRERPIHIFTVPVIVSPHLIPYFGIIFILQWTTFVFRRDPQFLLRTLRYLDSSCSSLFMNNTNQYQTNGQSDAR
jgi:hypothetical protein